MGEGEGTKEKHPCFTMCAERISFRIVSKRTSSSIQMKKKIPLILALLKAEWVTERREGLRGSFRKGTGLRWAQGSLDCTDGVEKLEGWWLLWNEERC